MMIRISAVAGMLVAGLVFGHARTASAVLLAPATGGNGYDFVHIQDASSSLLGFNNRSAPNTINLSGLSGAVGPTQTHSTTDIHLWNSAGGPSDLLPAYISYDLGKNYSFNDVGNYIKVWNANETLSRGAENVQVYVSPDRNPANFVKLNTTGANAQTNGSGDFTFPQATGAGYTGFTLDLANLANASLLSDVRLVRFDILTNRAGDQITGFSEVQFDATLVSTPALVTKLPTGSVTIASGGFGGNELTNAVSSEYGGRPAVATRNKSGIATNGMTVGAVQHDDGAGNQWMSNGLPTVSSPEWITWDLGSSTILDHIHVWNYMESVSNLSSRGSKDVQILVSPTTDLADLVPLDNITVGGGFEFPRAVEAGQYGFDIFFDDVLNPLLLNDVRLVRFRITSTHGSTEFTGIAEAEFYSTDVPYSVSAVPEPHTLGLGLCSLVGVALLVWRRRR